MSDLVFTPTRIQTKDLYMPKDLHNCEYVFLQNDTVKRPLCPTYSGPFQDIDRKPKYCTVVIKGKQDAVSIDRLKPGYLDLPIKNSMMEHSIPLPSTKVS